MRSVILSLLVVQLLLSGAYSDGEERMKRPMCANPRGKLGASILSGCSQATCKKEGKGKAVWQACEQVATQKTAEDLGRKMDKNHEVIARKIERNHQEILEILRMQMQTTTTTPIFTSTTLTSTTTKTTTSTSTKTTTTTTTTSTTTITTTSTSTTISTATATSTSTSTTTTTTTTTTTSTITTEAKSCPSGWSIYESSCYRFYSSKISWTQAKAECEKESSYLASITNVGKVTFTGGLQKNDNAWIGGFRPAGSNPKVGWEWLDKSQIWSFENWNSGEPNRAHELCILQYGQAQANKWNDAPCSDTWLHGYICETMATPDSFLS